MNHQKGVKLERDYYHKNTELVKEKTNNIAHYSFDWSQNVSLPHFSQQPSQIYFLTARKVHLFGVLNEATKIQTNYVLDENKLLDKGVNGTLSLVFDAIKKFNHGEKHLKLNCDNCAGQNKNNTTIYFLLYLSICGFYETIELNFMIAGHTKFRVDDNFGLIKRLYRKSTINCKEEFIEVVEKSISQGLNQVQCYENGEGFQYLNLKVLEKYFSKLPNVNKYHHFLFESSNLGVVKIKEFFDSPWIEINLWKDKKKSVEDVKEIRELLFPILMPLPLKLKKTTVSLWGN